MTEKEVEKFKMNLDKSRVSLSQILGGYQTEREKFLARVKVEAQKYAKGDNDLGERMNLDEKIEFLKLFDHKNVEVREIVTYSLICALMGKDDAARFYLWQEEEVSSFEGNRKYPSALAFYKGDESTDFSADKGRGMHRSRLNEVNQKINGLHKEAKRLIKNLDELIKPETLKEEEQVNLVKELLKNLEIALKEQEILCSFRQNNKQVERLREQVEEAKKLNQRASRPYFARVS